MQKLIDYSNISATLPAHYRSLLKKLIFLGPVNASFFRRNLCRSFSCACRAAIRLPATHSFGHAWAMRVFGGIGVKNGELCLQSLLSGLWTLANHCPMIWHRIWFLSGRVGVDPILSTGAQGHSLEKTLSTNLHCLWNVGGLGHRRSVCPGPIGRTSRPSSDGQQGR